MRRRYEETLDTEAGVVAGAGPDAALETRTRQAAAAFLRAARLTDDAAERDALRHKAAELLDPSHARKARRTAR